ncbi:MAG: hypothetical protein GX973_01030 [Firmicutes bacterium]|nr:hypothetical protein [Bacillota bacterium]
MKEATFEDTYQINLVASFLLDHPEIFTINYDLDTLSYCFSFMIKDKITVDRYRQFCKRMVEIWNSYCHFLKTEASGIKFCKDYYQGLTRLDLYFAKDPLTREEVNLVSSVITDNFGADLVDDYRKEPLDFLVDSRPEDDYLEYLLIQGEKKVKTLFAFREEGKVYVLNK